MARLAALALQIRAEPRSATQQVIDMAAGDKGAAALLDADQTLVDQHANRAANGVPVDPEPRGELRLGRQTPVREARFGHIMAQTFGDLAPTRDPFGELQNCHVRVFQWKKRLYTPLLREIVSD